MGKGSKPRPKSVDADTYASNWDRIFSGRGLVARAPGSNPEDVGSIPAAPATYVTEIDGKLVEVDEDYWPSTTG